MFDYSTPADMAQHLVSLMPALGPALPVPADKAVKVKLQTEPGPITVQQQQQQQQAPSIYSWKQWQEPQRHEYVTSKVGPQSVLAPLPACSTENACIAAWLSFGTHVQHQGSQSSLQGVPHRCWEPL